MHARDLLILVLLGPMLLATATMSVDSDEEIQQSCRAKFVTPELLMREVEEICDEGMCRSWLHLGMAIRAKRELAPAPKICDSLGGPRSLVVLANSRSGSHWLIDLLHQHQCVRWIQPEVLNAQYEALDMGRLDSALAMMREFQSGRGSGYFGFSIPPHKHDLPSEIWEFLWALVAKPTSRLIVLTREDTFLRTLSWIRSYTLSKQIQEGRGFFENCKNPWTLSASSDDECRTFKVTARPQLFSRRYAMYAASAQEMESLAQRASEKYPGRVIKVSYEDLQAAGGIPDAVADALGLDKVFAGSTSSLKKTGSDDPEELLANIHEVCAASALVRESAWCSSPCQCPDRGFVMAAGHPEIYQCVGSGPARVVESWEACLRLGDACVNPSLVSAGCLRELIGAGSTNAGDSPPPPSGQRNLSRTEPM
eukprot:g3210.t1